MQTWHIHIKGQVQGVGFRPYVFSLAARYRINGWVNNAVDGVHIVFNADRNLALKFKTELVARAPRLSHITFISLYKIQQKFFDNFQIIHSEKAGEANLLLTPDFALCADCRTELKEVSNHRNGYLFTTCINCGPRFSIIHQLPYDRINTKMDRFSMCITCISEYENPLDRRYYSQTNSCPNCSIKLSLFDDKQKETGKNPKEIIDGIVKAWEMGKIVAIKGIGGYLLTCDATNKEAIIDLRKKKHRPSKPFAVMYPDVNSLIEFYLTEKAVQELQSHVSPIVLLNLKAAADSINEIAPGLNQIGVLLPYTPFYELLMSNFGKPIIATSGNISHSPIVFDDKKALNELSKIADLIVVNNREIVIPQDDSVVKYTNWQQQKIILRRSRGLAPTYINKDLTLPTQNILAMGAMLKSTFCFLNKGNTYISQYLGNSDHFDTQKNYKHTIEHFLNLFNAQPEIILCDQHPEYASTQYGEAIAEKSNVPIHHIQHHISHFGAVLGEHNLLHTATPILGIIWDGTGLGDDRQIWGGEFFKYERYDFLRCYHFDYFDFILGDKMPKEPRISALSACWDVMGAETFLEGKFSKIEWQIYSKMLNKENLLKTSSVGRIFDAVASLLGIMDKQTYEGEAAMQLEAMATKYFKKHGLDFSSSYFIEGAHYYRIPTKSLMTSIIMDLQKGKSKDFIAAKFHFSLTKLIKIVANNLKIEKIAFSGGVFQNGLLIDLIHHHLSSEFELFFHQQLSPNDENISFGQLVCYQIEKYRNQ